MPSLSLSEFDPSDFKFCEPDRFWAGPARKSRLWSRRWSIGGTSWGRLASNQNAIREEIMLRDATVTRNSVDTPVEAMSRRALLTASAGLLGAATLAPGAGPQ